MTFDDQTSQSSPQPPDIGLAQSIVDGDARAASIERFREQGIRLPTFAELRDPSTMDEATIKMLADVDASQPDARNLFRVHWFNDRDRAGFMPVPDHIELPSSVTGVDARIVLALGARFPMIDTHKVLAAYACLVPRVITGRFDPQAHRAIWPSTGNYARGGVAISRIMGCHGVAVLPAGMSQERFDWLDRWTLDPAEDIIRTPGTESNVKEIYDACTMLAADPQNVVINQFSEMPNYLAHRTVTGPALDKVWQSLNGGKGRLAGFVSATGSAGTIGAGDYLKETYGTEIVAVEALECPTMLENGFGEHNIQGIGDKHIPLIHNVHNTDMVVAVSDSATDQLDLLFQTPAGRDYLVSELGVEPALVELLENLGYSSIANLLGAIAFADSRGLGSDDVVISVATDPARLYNSGRPGMIDRDFGGTFAAADAAVAYERHLSDPSVHARLDLDERETRRVFNLGYFTWVEQLNLDIDTFVARREQSWWDAMVPTVDVWDQMIQQFNDDTGQSAH